MISKMFAKVVLLAALIAGCHSVNFIIRNNEIGAIWVGILGNAGKAPLANGGFVLEAFTETVIYAPDDWAGRFWARTWCSWDNFFCETGDCGFRLECAGNGGAPPVSLAEITLRGWGGLDYYDISLVDGFNVKASMEPVDGWGVDGPYGCKKAACDYYINDDCPAELRLYGSAGWTIGCKSACLAFNTDQYCCRGDYGLPETCRSSDWPVNWPAFFKERCPDAYSYAYDDHSSTFTCIANTYRVTFG
uniref:Thaumatin n=1 Tax=Oryctes rhinoceros TaxID=72550 RepID=A0A6B9ERB9_ORYRH|nr:thaumatin [Oryctes rhinoceros]